MAYIFGTIFQIKSQLIYHMLVIKLIYNYIKNNNREFFKFSNHYVTEQEIVHVEL